MKFLCFIRHAERYRASGPPAALLEAMGRFLQQSMQDGSLVDTGGLLPSVRADLLVKLGRYPEAVAEFERAAAMTQNTRERALLQARAEANRIGQSNLRLI